MNPVNRALFILTFLFACMTGGAVSAQTGKVRGFVYDENKNPVPFANVVVTGTNIGTLTSEGGYYVLNNVPVGNQEIQVILMGYQTSKQPVTVSATRVPQLDFTLREESVILGDVEVNAERQEQKTQVLTSVVTLNPKRIEQFSVGGDADLIRAIQVLPGVITTGDQGGQLYIRGGAPIQNLVLLDGMIVYNPFHSIGFFSVFDTDILQSADVFTGGFNAEYGSRTSSVMDIRTRVGNRKHVAGKISASSYSAKLLLEGPLSKPADGGFAPGSFILSAKTSYLDRTDDIFYPYVETEYGGLPFNFLDLYGKLSLVSSNGSNVNGYGFSFNDDVTFGAGDKISWTSRGLGADFTIVPPGSAVLIDGDLAYSNYDITADQTDGLERRSSINGFNGGLDFTYFLRKNDELKYGIEAIGYQTDFRYVNELGSTISQTENTTELGGYMRYKIATNRWLIEPGFRVHYYGSLAETSLEPRFGVKYNWSERFRLKASGGLYSQNLVAANSDRDVVNLFYGFLSGSGNLPSDFRGEEVTSNLQRARHLILGFEYEFNKYIDINVEGYIKDFNQMTNVNRNKLYENTDEYLDKPDVLKYDYIVEKGLATGVDVLVKVDYKAYYLWVAYSLSKVTRDDGVQEYYPHFDRRHNLNMVGSYVFGKDREWEVNARYNFGTGFPFTPQVGFAVNLPFTDPSGAPTLDYDYTTENGELKVLYGDLNSKRLPNYHRFDLSVKRTFTFSKRNTMEINAGATNVLNRNNIFYFNRIRYKRVDQLPIMPTIGITYTF